MMRALKGTTAATKEKAYQSLIRPIIEYGATVWDPYKTQDVKELEQVQRIAARRVMGRNRKWGIRHDLGTEPVRVRESPTEMIS